jgi:hypothetical protein
MVGQLQHTLPMLQQAAAVPVQEEAAILCDSSQQWIEHFLSAQTLRAQTQETVQGAKVKSSECKHACNRARSGDLMLAVLFCPCTAHNTSNLTLTPTHATPAAATASHANKRLKCP